MSTHQENRFALTAQYAGSDGLRHTPAGLPTLRLRLLHRSQQTEGGRARLVEVETEAVAFGEIAKRLAAVGPGEEIGIAGFLDRRSVKNPALELHVTELFSPQ